MKKIVLLLVLSASTLMVSCKKNASTFQGQVRYIDSTGAYLPAANAIVTIHPNDTAKAAEFTGTTDSEGIFQMENISDGTWVVKGELTIDSTTTYVGVTKKLECAKKDFVSAPIDLTEI